MERDQVAPTLSKWIQQFQSKAEKIDADFPSNLLLLKEGTKTGEVNLLAIEERSISLNSYLTLSPFQKKSFNPISNQSWPSFLIASDSLNKATRADTILLQPSKGLWQIKYYSPNAAAPRKINFTPPDNGSIQGLLRAIFAALGYDGVVLEQNGDYALVGTISGLLTPLGIQAMALANSTKNFSLQETSFNGMALMTLIEAIDGYGLFKIARLSSSELKIPQGTKIIIERSTRKPLKNNVDTSKD